MRRPLLLTPVIAAAVVAIVALVALGACSETITGSPVGPVPGTNRATLPPPGTGATASSGTTDAPALDLEPCELLSASDQTRLQLSPSARGRTATPPTCMWVGLGGDTLFAVYVVVNDNIGLDDVGSSTPVKPLRIGSHRAVQFAGWVSTCFVALGVGESARVDVEGEVVGDVSKACDVARRAAPLVEPKLP